MTIRYVQVGTRRSGIASKTIKLQQKKKRKRKRRKVKSKTEHENTTRSFVNTEVIPKVMRSE